VSGVAAASTWGRGGAAATRPIYHRRCASAAAVPLGLTRSRHNPTHPA
jgi:hypothetical protein